MSSNILPPQPDQPQSKLVHNMFDAIAPSYDRANDWISVGLLHRWRRKLVRWSEAASGQRVLDCATGTGDLAFEFYRTVKPNGSVHGIDFVSSMVDIAKQKAKNRGTPIEFSVGDAMKIPFANESFDISSIAFGLRNVEDPIQCLREMARVTKRRGYIMILETGRTHIPLYKQIFGLYYGWLMPKIGGYLSGQPQAYSYLQKSSAGFPYGQELVQLIHSMMDFEFVQAKSLSGGVCYMYKLRRK